MHQDRWLSRVFAVIVLPLRSLFVGVQELEIFTNVEFGLSFFCLIFSSNPSIIYCASVCLYLILTAPPGWCNETKAVHCCHVVDGIKDPLYHNGQNNKNRATFFQGSEKVARQGIRSSRHNTSTANWSLFQAKGI